MGTERKILVEADVDVTSGNDNIYQRTLHNLRCLFSAFEVLDTSHHMPLYIYTQSLHIIHITHTLVLSLACNVQETNHPHIIFVVLFIVLLADTGRSGSTSVANPAARAARAC